MAAQTVRAALVLNGGVSLAVWMGGVTHEIDRLRRGQASGAWKRISDAAHCDLVVDVVAGTSAGGLNGAFLADSIARGSAVPDLRALWTDQARLWRGRLLHRQGSQDFASLLDGDYLFGSVKGVMDRSDAGNAAQDVTLLVTSSALHGSTTAVRDARGEEFTAGDHRRVFRFRRRQGVRTWAPPHGFTSSPVDDFTDHADELQLAVRASAGFPFAFEPVRETRALHDLNIAAGVGEPSWLVDGGVLDNAPFGPLLDELMRQPREEPGERWILYVVPGVTSRAGQLPAGREAQPPPWTGLPGRLLGLSRESDLRDDVEALKRSATESRSYVHRAEDLIGDDVAGAPGDPEAVAQALWGSYLRTRAGALVHRFHELHGTDVLSQHRVTEDEIAAILGGDLSWIPDRLAPSREMDGTQCWQWGIGTARRIARWISRDARGTTGRGALGSEVSALVARTEEELEALQLVFERTIADAVATGSDVVGAPQAADEALRDSGLTAVVLQLMEAMVEIWSDAREQSLGAAWTRLLSVEVMTNSLSWQLADQPPMFSLYLVSPNSPHTGTVLDLGDLADPSRHPSWPDNKLFGTRLGHFGAFGAGRFREWDWMWGRLDGALTLADALLDRADVSHVHRRAMVDDLVEEILEECGMSPAEVQPSLARVMALTPGELVALARDSKETDFDAAIDDMVAMLGRARWLTKPARSGWLERRKAGVRAWLLARVLGLLGRWARRLVRKQQAPSA